MHTPLKGGECYKKECGGDITHLFQPLSFQLALKSCECKEFTVRGRRNKVKLFASNASSVVQMERLTQIQITHTLTRVPRRRTFNHTPTQAHFSFLSTLTTYIRKSFKLTHNSSLSAFVEHVLSLASVSLVSERADGIFCHQDKCHF